MVLSQPLVARGMGGQDVDDLYDEDGTDDQSNLVVLGQPQLWFTVPIQSLIRIAFLAERALGLSLHSILLSIVYWPKRYEPRPHWSSVSSDRNKTGIPNRSAGQIQRPPNRPTLSIYSHSFDFLPPSASHCSSIDSALSDSTIHSLLPSQTDE